MEFLLVVLMFLVALAFYFGIDCLLALGVQWVLAQVLGHPVPFWPVFFGVFLLMIIVRPPTVSVKST